MSSDVPLLRWGIEHSDAGELQRQAEEGQRKSFDPELIEMILGKDDPVRMRECVEVILDETRGETERLQAYELLADLAAQIDNANSVAKMGLWDRLLPLLESPVEGLRTSTLDFVAICSRNNPDAAQYLARQGVLRKLVERGCKRAIPVPAVDPAVAVLAELASPANPASFATTATTAASTQEARKLISACSALFQSGQGGFAEFVRLEGLEMFAQLLDQHGADEGVRLRMMHSLNFVCMLEEGEPEALRTHPILHPALQAYRRQSASPSGDE